MALSDKPLTKKRKLNDISTYPTVDPKLFKWTPKYENCLLSNMIGIKPCGVNKHLHMLLIWKKVCKELKLNIPCRCIWEYLETKWDLAAADDIELSNFENSMEHKFFDLDDEYKELIPSFTKSPEHVCPNSTCAKKEIVYMGVDSENKSDFEKESNTEAGPSTLIREQKIKRKPIRIIKCIEEYKPNFKNKTDLENKSEIEDDPSILIRKRFTRKLNIKYKSNFEKKTDFEYKSDIEEVPLALIRKMRIIEKPLRIIDRIKKYKHNFENKSDVENKSDIENKSVIENKVDLKNKSDLENKTDLKNKTDVENKSDIENKVDLKNKSDFENKSDIEAGPPILIRQQRIRRKPLRIVDSFEDYKPKRKTKAHVVKKIPPKKPTSKKSTNSKQCKKIETINVRKNCKVSKEKIIKENKHHSSTTLFCVPPKILKKNSTSLTVPDSSTSVTTKKCNQSVTPKTVLSSNDKDKETKLLTKNTQPKSVACDLICSSQKPGNSKTE